MQPLANRFVYPGQQGRLIVVGNLPSLLYRRMGSVISVHIPLKQRRPEKTSALVEERSLEYSILLSLSGKTPSYVETMTHCMARKASSHATRTVNIATATNKETECIVNAAICSIWFSYDFRNKKSDYLLGTKNDMKTRHLAFRSARLSHIARYKQAEHHPNILMRLCRKP